MTKTYVYFVCDIYDIPSGPLLFPCDGVMLNIWRGLAVESKFSQEWKLDIRRVLWHRIIEIQWGSVPIWEIYKYANRHYASDVSF